MNLYGDKYFPYSSNRNLVDVFLQNNASNYKNVQSIPTLSPQILIEYLDTLLKILIFATCQLTYWTRLIIFANSDIRFRTSLKKSRHTNFQTNLVNVLFECHYSVFQTKHADYVKKNTETEQNGDIFNEFN